MVLRRRLGEKRGDDQGRTPIFPLPLSLSARATSPRSTCKPPFWPSRVCPPIASRRRTALFRLLPFAPLIGPLLAHFGPLLVDLLVHESFAVFLYTTGPRQIYQRTACFAWPYPTN